MRLSIRKRSTLKPAERLKLPAGGQDCLVVRCTCMAQINDQDRKPDVNVPWRFWGYDYIAIIPLTEPAAPVFAAHVAETDAQLQAAS